jgi:ParB/RepB/Spo0J family partition protein
MKENAMAGPTLAIAIEKLVAAERNPNQMDEAKLDALSELIQKYGFLQPILAIPLEGQKGTYRIVDGHHRTLAAERAGHTHVLALVRDSFSEAEIHALRVGMNVLRGDLNYTIAAEIAVELRDQWGWTQDAVGVAFGFSDEELDELFDLASGLTDDGAGLGGEDDGGPADAPPETGGDEAPPKAFELKIEYDSRSEYMKARRALRKHGGKNASLADCMAALIAAAKGE